MAEPRQDWSLDFPGLRPMDTMGPEFQVPEPFQTPEDKDPAYQEWLKQRKAQREADRQKSMAESSAAGHGIWYRPPKTPAFDVGKAISRAFNPNSYEAFQELGAKQGNFAPPVIPPDTTPGTETAASQKLAEPFETPAPKMPAEGTANIPDTKKARDRVMDFYRSQMAKGAQPSSAIGGTKAPVTTIGEPPAAPMASPMAAGPNDFFNRYKQASDEEHRALIRAGGERDLAQGMSNMLTTGAQIRSGSSPVQFGTGASDARAIAASMKRGNMDNLEKIDPTSSRSKSLQQFVKTQFPDLPIQNLENMSAAEILEKMPFLEKAADRLWRSGEAEQNRDVQREHFKTEAATRQALGAQENYYQEQMIDLRRRGQERLEKNQKMLPILDARKLQEKLNTLNRINLIDKEFHENTDKIGPVEGRIQRIAIRAGIAKPGIAVTNANLVGLVAEWVRSISGVAVAEAEFRRLRESLPNVAQNPKQFKALLDNFKGIVQNEYDNILQIQKRQGHDTSEFGLETFDQYAPSGSTVNVVWPETGETITIKRAGLQKALDSGYEEK